jgi:carbonic anhydrase
MPPRVPFVRRPVPIALLCATLAALSAAVVASDAHASDNKPEPHASKAAATVPADRKAAPIDHGKGGTANPVERDDHPATARKASAQPERADARNGPDRGTRIAKPELRDPMDALREKLAQKLGAAPSANPRVLRLAAQSPEQAAVPPPSGHRAAGGSHKALSSGPRSAAGKPMAVAALAPHGAPGQAPHAGGAHAPHWDYAGDAGPESWGRLKAEFAQCSNGQRQSPIDIRDGIKLQLDAVQFDYRPSNFRVIDNGHTVQVNVAPGNAIQVVGRRYDLVQFHFHRPSEERINGRVFDMVAHLVHKDQEGRLAVVAVLLDRGSAHPLIQQVWNNLPLEKNEELPARAPLDLNALLPADRGYYTYMGSLTTPPCSEGVMWMVMKTPVTVSAEQVAIFSRLYPMNARPLQSASGRMIKESD